MSAVFDPYHTWLGIPPREQPPNYYRLLGVSLFESHADVIANAADQRIAHVRTFQLGKHSDESQRILSELAVARVCLLNADKKAEYDAGLQSAIGPPPVSSTAMSATQPPRARSAPRPLSHPWRGRSLVWWYVAGGSAVALLVIAVALSTSERGSEIPTAADSTTDTGAHSNLSMPLSQTSDSGQKQPTPAPRDSRDAVPLEAPAVSATGGTSVPPQAPGEIGVSSPALTPPAVSQKIPEAKKADVAPYPQDTSPEETPALPPLAETLEQAEERLRAYAARDSSPESLRTVAREALTTALRTVMDAKPEAAKRLATLALVSSRKAKSGELISLATLLLVEFEQSSTEVLREKAGQWLIAVESVQAASASDSSPAKAKPRLPEVESDGGNNLMVAPPRPPGTLKDAPAADAGDQVLGSTEFARRQEASDIFKEFQEVVHEAIRTELDSFEGKPFKLAYSYSRNMARLTHTLNAGLSVRNFPETETYAFVSASIIGTEIVVQTKLGKRPYDAIRGEAFHELCRVRSASPRDWSDVQRVVRTEIRRIIEDVVRPKMPRPGNG